MYSKICFNLLLKIFHFFVQLIKMCTLAESDVSVGRQKLYAFKPYHYAALVPKKSTQPPWPFARSGHRMGADSGNFYSFGGYNPLFGQDNSVVEDDNWTNSYPLFQELWRFNFARKKWTRYPNSHTMPLELASNALILQRNVLMVYGGTGSPFGFRCSNQLFICRVNDEKGDMVEIQTTGQLPLPLYGQALVYHNDYLYTIGGTTGLDYTCDIHRLNVKTLTWEIVYVRNSGKHDYEPSGRYRHEVGFDQKNIYILGGGTGFEAYDFDNVPVFNIEKKKWYTQRTLRDKNRGIPAPRRCHGAVQINIDSKIQVFISGGHDGDNVFDDLWRLDLTTFQWTCFEKCCLPHPTYFHAAAATPEGKMCIFGGIYSLSNDRVFRGNAIFTTWLCIPKLSEICWEAVLHYSPHIVNCKSRDLINIGMPRHFIERLDLRA